MAIATVQDTEASIGFLPNSGAASHEAAIVTDRAKQGLVRLWLTQNGIPQKAANNAIATSLARAYVYRSYLKGWRKRVNPDWDLLGGGDEASPDDAVPPADPTLAARPTATTPVANPAQTEAWLKDLYAQIKKTVEQEVTAKINATKLELSPDAKAQIRALANAAGKEAAVALMPPREILVANATTGTSINIGRQHKSFEKLLKVCGLRNKDNHRLNIWLTGPTGSGKTSAAVAVAKALDLAFGSDGSLDNDYKVLGWRDAAGNIISTEFLRIYKNGGIYIADEIDNWMPSALLSLNAALANGWCSTPEGIVQRHPDACIIACANTWGLGANMHYVGRSRLDAASLDRFQPKMAWDYDEELERQLAIEFGGETGLHWAEIIQKARKNIFAQGLQIICSPRATFDGIALLKGGFDVQDVADMTVASGISAEQKKAIGLDHLAPITPAQPGAEPTDDIRFALDHNNKIEAIRLYRDHYGVSLYEAKEAVEAMMGEAA